MPKTASTATATIWTTAKLTEVNRRHRRMPARAMTLGPAWPAGRPVARSVDRPMETLVKARRCYTAAALRQPAADSAVSRGWIRRSAGALALALGLALAGRLALGSGLDGQHQRLRGGTGDTVLATPLGRIHRAVGADEQGIGGAAVRGVGHDADRDGRAGIDAGHPLLRDHEPHLLREDPATGRIGLGQQSHELVPAVAGRDVDLAHAAADDVGDGPQ